MIPKILTYLTKNFLVQYNQKVLHKKVSFKVVLLNPVVLLNVKGFPNGFVKVHFRWLSSS